MAKQLATSQISLLVVEDSPEFQQLVAAAFNADRFDVTIAATAAEALRSLDVCQPDVVILDLGLPDMDGVELCRQIRHQTTCWLVMLTGRDDELDQVMGLAAGADDYVTKPFSLPVLRARVEALLRRSERLQESGPNEEAALVLGNVRVDVAARLVSVAGTDVRLTRKEFDLLQTLGSRPGRVLTRLELVHAVWGSDWFGDDHVVDVHMGNLRRKLSEADADMVVETVRGIGFKASASGI